VSQPRFLVIAGTPSGGSRQWPSGWGDASDPDSRDPWFAWRLVGANNHDLGRSFSSYPDLESCRRALAALPARVLTAEPIVTTSDVSGQWGWRLEDGGEPVAVSSRTYPRQRECAYNIQQFLAAVPSAEVAEGVVVRPVPRELNRPDLEIPELQLPEQRDGSDDGSEVAVS